MTSDIGTYLGNYKHNQENKHNYYDQIVSNIVW